MLCKKKKGECAVPDFHANNETDIKGYFEILWGHMPGRCTLAFKNNFK